MPLPALLLQLAPVSQRAQLSQLTAKAQQPFTAHSATLPGPLPPQTPLQTPLQSSLELLLHVTLFYLPPQVDEADAHPKN